MATILKTFRKVLGSTSAEALSATAIYCPGFIVRAEQANTGDIYIGDSGVTTSNGMFIHADEANDKFARALAGGRNTTYNLSKIYIVGNSGDAVRVEYESDE